MVRKAGPFSPLFFFRSARGLKHDRPSLDPFFFASLLNHGRPSFFFLQQPGGKGRGALRTFFPPFPPLLSASPGPALPPFPLFFFFFPHGAAAGGPGPLALPPGLPHVRISFFHFLGKEIDLLPAFPVFFHKYGRTDEGALFLFSPPLSSSRRPKIDRRAAVFSLFLTFVFFFYLLHGAWWEWDSPLFFPLCGTLQEGQGPFFCLGLPSEAFIPFPPFSPFSPSLSSAQLKPAS